MSKEFKAGDKVRALEDSFSGDFLKGGIYEVSLIYEEGEDTRIRVVADSDGSPNGWLADNFELVEIFDDLIDVAVKAWKDGYLKVLEFESGAVKQIFTVIGEDAYRWHEGDVDYNHAVGLINSLYTETFVINTANDILRVRNDTPIYFTDGEEGVFIDSYDNGFSAAVKFRSAIHNFPLELLKGATITQKKDIK